MEPTQTGAILVTYYPDADVLQNLDALRPQVSHLLVVDNGSSPSALNSLRSAAKTLNFELLENGDNLGIGAALNIGVRRAQSLGLPWVFLFDQDSRVTPGFVTAMQQTFTTSRWGDRLTLLVPSYMDMRSETPLPRQFLPSGGLEFTMTSGSLFRTQTFAQHGLFAEELFIDGVDHEYSLRLRRAGLILDECPTAVLLHSPGTPVSHVIAGKFRFNSTNYSPIRRYYQERNKLWIYKHYFSEFPGYCFRLSTTSAKDFVKILFFESNKRQKLAFFFRGILDGLRHRMGKFEPRKPPPAV